MLHHQQNIPFNQTNDRDINLIRQIEHSNLLTFMIYPYLSTDELLNCKSVSSNWYKSTDHQIHWYRLCKYRNMTVAKINERSFTNWKQLYEQSRNQQIKLKKQKYKNIFKYLFDYNEHLSIYIQLFKFFICSIILLMFIFYSFFIYEQSHIYDRYHEKLIGNITEWSIENTFFIIYQPKFTYQFIYENNNYTHDRIFYYNHFYFSENNPMDVINVIWNHYSPNQQLLNQTNCFVYFNPSNFNTILAHDIMILPYIVLMFYLIILCYQLPNTNVYSILFNYKNPNTPIRIYHEQLDKFVYNIQNVSENGQLPLSFQWKLRLCIIILFHFISSILTIHYMIHVPSFQIDIGLFIYFLFFLIGELRIFFSNLKQFKKNKCSYKSYLIYKEFILSNIYNDMNIYLIEKNYIQIGEKNYIFISQVKINPFFMILENIFFLLIFLLDFIFICL
jgi:hypothetical protein